MTRFPAAGAGDDPLALGRTAIKYGSHVPGSGTRLAAEGQHLTLSLCGNEYRGTAVS